MNAKQRQYLNLIKTKPYLLGVWSGFKDLGQLHNDWLRSFLFNKDDQTLLAHRGSYKTTTLAIALALMIVLYPSKNIIFFRKTDTDITEIINQVSKLLKSDLFIKLVYVLYNVQLTLTKDTTSEIDTNLHTNTKGTSQLVGIGINGSITGKHADIVITDDIVNVKDRISRAERERTKLQYQELQNIKNRGGRIINTGTPWHKEDAISLMPNVRKFDCYQTGLITKEQLQNLRSSMASSLFSANYELKHIADEDAMFSSPKFTAESYLLKDGVCHIDASYNGADGTAFTIMRDLGDRVITFGKRWDKHVDDCLNEIIEYRKHFMAGSIACETNADKGYLAKELRKRGEFVDEYHESQNKFIKIATHLRKSWSEIEFVEESDPNYINEILDYTENAEHDDSPDSASSLLRKLRGYEDWLF